MYPDPLCSDLSRYIFYFICDPEQLGYLPKQGCTLHMVGGGGRGVIRRSRRPLDTRRAVQSQPHVITFSSPRSAVNRVACSSRRRAHLLSILGCYYFSLGQFSRRGLFSRCNTLRWYILFPLQHASVVYSARALIKPFSFYVMFY